MHIRKNDTIQVIAGDDAGKTGKVLHVMTKEKRVIIEGINYIQKQTLTQETNYIHIHTCIWHIMLALTYIRFCIIMINLYAL